MDTSKAAKDQSKVMFVLGTAIGERVMRPMFGASIANAVGMTSPGARIGDSIQGNTAPEVIVTAIMDAFETRLGHLVLVDVEIDTAFADSVLFVDVVWAYPGDSSTTFSGRVDVSGFVDRLGD